MQRFGDIGMSYERLRCEKRLYGLQQEAVPCSVMPCSEEFEGTALYTVDCCDSDLKSLILF